MTDKHTKPAYIVKGENNEKEIDNEKEEMKVFFQHMNTLFGISNDVTLSPTEHTQ
jgi:hypothetical protein